MSAEAPKARATHVTGPARADLTAWEPTASAPRRAAWSEVTDAGFRLGKALFRLGREVTGEAVDADKLLQRTMGTFVEVARARYPVDPGAEWRPGVPLKLLFAGYSGTRNTGADVRVEEMIRQFRHVFGDENLDLSILTIDPALSRGYFRTVKQLHLPQLFPKFLFDTVHEQHGVVACEGSMFKSKFANALSTMMAGALGLACAEEKLAVGYGGEAGAMDPSLEALVRKTCREAFVIARNVESRAVLARLGIASEAGTDTAWTFEPRDPHEGERLLRRAGWDGRAPVLALAPIHPFFWPVKPDVARGLAHWLVGAYDDAHYDSIYFHASGPDVDRAFARYTDAYVRAARAFASRRRCFVITVGMERLDRVAVERVAAGLGGAPMFVSDEHDCHAMVSVLRECRWLAASRYHAMVTSMPAGVASLGVTMDERIRNLVADRGEPELALDVAQPDLADALEAGLEHLAAEEQAIRERMAKCVARNLVRMGEMGRSLVRYTRSRHPGMPLREHLDATSDPLAHLPPLSPRLEQVLDRYAGARGGSEGVS